MQENKVLRQKACVGRMPTGLTSCDAIDEERGGCDNAVLERLKDAFITLWRYTQIIRCYDQLHLQVWPVRHLAARSFVFSCQDRS